MHNIAAKSRNALIVSVGPYAPTMTAFYHFITNAVLHFSSLIIINMFVLRARRKASFASTSYARANSSLCSVRHSPVLCQNEGTQRDAVFTSGNPVSLVY